MTKPYLVLVSEGKIFPAHLEALQKDELWLRQQLTCPIEQVFWAGCTAEGELCSCLIL